MSETLLEQNQVGEVEPLQNEVDTDLTEQNKEVTTSIIYFSIEKQAFFSDVFMSRSDMPQDVVEITAEQHQSLLTALNQGAVILADLTATTAKPSSFHQWNGKEWEISPEAQVELLAEKKMVLIELISTKADQLKSIVFAGYSTAEVESFYRQEKEALALKDDPTYPALMLSSIANSRGVPLEILAQKVLEKADFAAPIIGSILGKKQQFEDRIQAVENFADFANLEEEIEQWQL